MSKSFLMLLFLSSGLVSFPGSATADSLSVRLDRMRGLVGELSKALDSLQTELSASKANGPHADSSNLAVTPENQPPIIGELLSEKEKRLASAATTPYRRGAIGYSFDPNLSIGMHYLGWNEYWGIKAEATGRFTESVRQAGMEIKVLRTLHRFSLFEGLQTHLYAFAGTGLFWRREQYQPLYLFPPNPQTASRAWYETADLPLRFQLGAGTELGLITLGGLRASPEIGFQAAHFINRYQDSQSWQDEYRLAPGFQVRPKSDYSLDAYFAFHLSFYFR